MQSNKHPCLATISWQEDVPQQLTMSWQEDVPPTVDNVYKLQYDNWFTSNLKTSRKNLL